jgi:ATP-dependent exoDNAse (exonuclease V) beta subunit
MENPDMYKGIDHAVLMNAARKGTNLHKQIEDFELHGIFDSRSSEMQNYLRIKRKYNIVKKMTEKMVIIKHEGKVICAGRFDLFASIEGIPALIDFKRTSQIHHEYIKLQLNLYRLGLKQCYNEDIDILMLIRLRYEQVDVVKVSVDENYVYSVLNKYK